MSLFMPEEELARLAHATSVVAERADEYIRRIYAELDSERAKADAASQTCSLLEQKYISLSHDFSALESQNAKLQSDFDDRLAELAQSEAQKHQLHLQSIEKDGEVERMTTEMSELHKSKRQLMDLLEQKDAEISEKKSTIKSYLDKIVKLTDANSEKEARLASARAECGRLSREKELMERHATTTEEQYNAELSTVNKLVELYKESSEEWSRKAGELEGVIKALEARLRDGWSLAKIYEKYQEAVDALMHKQLSRKEAEMILQRVLSELEKKARSIQEEREEYERMVETYRLVLQDSVSEQSEMKKFIMELKREWAEAKKELQEESSNISSEMGKELANALKAVSVAESRASVSEETETDEELFSGCRCSS